MTSHAPPDFHPQTSRRRNYWRLAILVVALAAWPAVAYIELARLPKWWVLIYVVPPLEATIWVIAALATIGLAKVRPLPALLTRGVTAAAMALLIVHFNNWAFVEPQSYYLSHRGSFAEVAELVRAGDLGQSDDYYGEPLPWHLKDLSADGNASTVGVQDGKPVVFLPQWLGIPDDAGGYLYFDGEPGGDLDLDLYGRLVKLTDMHELGNGWWYA